MIEVRPFFAINLDADEVIIEDFRDLLIFKALVLHHMTPVAGRVANAEKDGPVELFRALKRLVAPGIPVHRIVSVLPQIGAGFVDEPIGELRLRRHGAP